MSYQQPPYQPPYPPPYPPPPPPAPPQNDGMAVAALVLGICALVLPYAGFAAGIVGLILGIMARKRLVEAGRPTGMATAGLIMSIVGLALWLIVIIWVCVACTAAVNYASSYTNWYNYY